MVNPFFPTTWHKYNKQNSAKVLGYVNINIIHIENVTPKYKAVVTDKVNPSQWCHYLNNKNNKNGIFNYWTYVYVKERYVLMGGVPVQHTIVGISIAFVTLIHEMYQTVFKQHSFATKRWSEPRSFLQMMWTIIMAMKRQD